MVHTIPSYLSRSWVYCACCPWTSWNQFNKADNSRKLLTFLMYILCQNLTNTYTCVSKKMCCNMTLYVLIGLWTLGLKQIIWSQILYNVFKKLCLIFKDGVVIVLVLYMFLNLKDFKSGKISWKFWKPLTLWIWLEVHQNSLFFVFKISSCLPIGAFF